MKNRISSLLATLVLVLSFCQLTLAAPVDEERAQLVAGNYLNYVVETFDRWEGKDPYITTIEPIDYEGDIVFWLVKIAPSGYMLVSSRDELSPVKMYSETGTFDPTQVSNPNAPESWIIPMQHAGVAYFANSTRAKTASADPVVSQQINDAWAIYGQTTSTKRTVEKTASEVGPLITALWDQMAPYNNQVPGSGCTNSLVGCVPLAWSMLLRHWQWPDRGVGSKTHTWNGQQYTVNFAEQTWNWGSMPDTLTLGSSTAQKDAIGKLVYQMGVAAEATWGCNSTGSNLYANTVLNVYFKYKDNMSLRVAGSTSADTWFGYFRTEFDAQPPRPIVMSIFGDAGGHEILADGYQTGLTNKVHLNMGWGGSSNAWYDVTSDFTTSGWIWDHTLSAIVTGIEPDYSQREPTTCTSQFLLLLQ